MILDKKQMTEEDIKLQYITPAIQAKWGPDRITMETKITDGRINLKGNIVIREKPKKTDYVLYLNKNKPIAIVELRTITILFPTVCNKQSPMPKCRTFLLHTVPMETGSKNTTF